ncbi:MAG: phage terminase large subunit [Chloroflexi bacterium]|jgi:predicted phage terminase large subunit-like protein|nr:phage terminase large subunit [Chloroflexota bacterium]
MTPNSLSREELYTQEFARRQLARQNFADFARYMLPEHRRLEMQPFHELVCRTLEQVLIYIMTGGEQGIGRLMIFMPPRYWKTLLASRLFPAWAMGKNPDLQVITTSYSGKLAFKNSRNARNFVMSQKYSALFGDVAGKAEPVQMSRDVQAVEEWQLAAPYRGKSWAAGAGGSITGEGAHYFDIDDPFKDRKEAESEGRRNDIWDWYLDVVDTRLERGGAVVIPQTRWHPDGLSGRLLREQAVNPQADRWHVLSLMGIWEPPNVPDGMTFEEYQVAEMEKGVWVDLHDPMGRKPGEVLWPSFQSREKLEAKRSVNPYGFSSLYQQQPYMRSGGRFREEYFSVTDKAPEREDIAAVVRYWDKAGTAGGGKFSAGVLMCRTKDNQFYILHVARGQWSPHERERKILQHAERDRKAFGTKSVTWLEQEPGSGGKESAQSTVRNLAGFRVRVETVSGKGNKEERAYPLADHAEGAGIMLLQGGWNRPYVAEMVAFSNGAKYTDQGDASSGAFNKLAVPVLESGFY